jgi:nucleotide-binding universal stress UspA family protein
MKILIYASTLDKSESAVLFGAMLARATQAEVTLLTVITEGHTIDNAHEVFEEALDWIPDLDVMTSIRVGPEADFILKEINAGDYDLVVLKSLQAVRKKLFIKSPMDQDITSHSLKSVLVVKERCSDLKRVLICTCGKDISNPVIEFGTYLAQSTQAKASLLHVTSAVPSMYTGLKKLDEHLSDMLKTDTPVAQHLRNAAALFERKEVDAQLKLRHGSVQEEILREAQSGDYDLIAIGGSKSAASLKGWLIGDVTQEIVRQAVCPVLVVRQKSPDHKKVSK